MSDNNSTYEVDLSDVERPLREKLAAVETEEARVRAEYEEVSAEYRARLRVIGDERRKVERTLNYLTTGSATGGVPNRHKAAKRVSDAAKEEVLRALREAGGEATVPELERGGLRMGTDTITAALAALRRDEVVRLAGKRKSKHDDRPHGAKARAWAVMGNG